MSDPAIIKELGQQLKRLRLKSNLTQQELSERSGLFRSTISEIENGRIASILSLIQILRALNQLELLLAPVAAMAGGEPTSRRPFWGDLWGHANFSFKRLRTPDGPLEGLSGRLNLRADTLRLSFGRLWLLDHQLGKFEGTITFDSSKAQPYEMKGAGNVERIDAPPPRPSRPLGRASPGLPRTPAKRSTSRVPRVSYGS